MFCSVSRHAHRPAVLAQRYAAFGAAAGQTCMGFDLSTQGLKATVINADCEVVYNTAINFDKDLPHYGTSGGAIDLGGGVVRAPTLMFVEAVDLVLGNMRADGFDFSTVGAISGSGQQHGSVFWRTGAAETLSSLSADTPLKEQLSNAFATDRGPIWMDSSTRAQCAALEDALGGALAVAQLTGSRAYERFTGNQIAKVAADEPTAFADTERISLVSSFLASLLSGRYAPIDGSDGAGMNLLDLRSSPLNWSGDALDACAATYGGDGTTLGKLLGDVADSHTVVGGVAAGLQTAYGFNPDCRVIACSGDNPCSVAGLGIQTVGDIGVSLGTSDTIFGVARAGDSNPGLEGHVFLHPVDPSSHMIMLCYANGSLSRERVCKATADGDWDAFGALLAQSEPGNAGHVGFFVDVPEITPGIPATGVRRFAPSGAPAAAACDAFADASIEARAVIEGQFMSMRCHAGGLGLAASRIIATGGASQNKDITQVLSNVFGVTVFATSQPDSASLGAAYRAMHGLACARAGSFVPFKEAVGDMAAGFTVVAEPDQEAHAAYTALLPRYQECEQHVIESC